MQSAGTYHQSVPDQSPCPADPQQIAETYVLGRLTADQTTAFEDHFVGCAACATVLQDAIGFVTAMRAAAEELALKSPRRAAARVAGSG